MNKLIGKKIERSINDIHHGNEKDINNSPSKLTRRINGSFRIKLNNNTKLSKKLISSQEYELEIDQEFISSNLKTLSLESFVRKSDFFKISKLKEEDFITYNESPLNWENKKNDLIIYLKKNQLFGICKENNNYWILILFSFYPKIIKSDIIIKELDNDLALKLLDNAPEITCFKNKEEINIKHLSDEVELSTNLLNSLSNLKKEVVNISNYFTSKNESLKMKIQSFNITKKELEKKDEIENPRIKSIFNQINEFKMKIAKKNIILHSKNKKLDEQITEKKELENITKEYMKSKIEEKERLNQNRTLLLNEISEFRLKINSLKLEIEKNKEISKNSNSIEKSRQDLEMLCKICKNSQRNLLFIDCKHLLYCSNCANKEFKIVQKSKKDNFCFFQSAQPVKCICGIENRNFGNILGEI